MHLLAVVAGLALAAAILWDTFETIVLPRTVTRRYGITRAYFRLTWGPWRALGCRLGARRERWLGVYGPLALIFLLVLWAAGLIVGFALVHWGIGSRVAPPADTPADFGTDLYFSGTTFFTLGLGDVAPVSDLARTVTVVESGTGFGFLALVISFLPAFYQAYSRREVPISLLDEWAGSPPSGAEMLRRLAEDDDLDTLTAELERWERWAAELMEIHLSYPWLGHFRSQHEHQSWLAALTAILDLCALVLVGIDRVPIAQARRTFAMARHAAVDLSQVLKAPPRPPEPDRLGPDELAALRALLAAAGIPLREGPDADAQLRSLRALYEPYVGGLSARLLMPLPAWLPGPEPRDDWQRTAAEGQSAYHL